MAEGDTILRAARRLDAALTGQTVAVGAPNQRGQAAGIERLDGRRLDRVESRGKNLLLHFGELVLHSHMGMNGAWHVYPRGGRWRKPRRAAWAVLAGERQEAVQFGGPTLRLIPAARLARDPQLGRLGPDVLGPGLRPRRRGRGPCAPTRPAPSATPCSTRPSSPASATSSRARPASLPASTPGARSPTLATTTSAPSSKPPAR